MIDIPKEIPVQKQPEKPSESTTLGQFSSALSQIIRSYSSQEGTISEQRKKLFKDQFTRLYAQFESYKTTPHGQKLLNESQEGPSNLDNIFLDIQTFLDGTDEKKILQGMVRMSDYPDKKAIFSLLPEEYTDDIQIEKDSQNFENNMVSFLRRTRDTIPHFNANSFRDHPQIITKFLETPGRILGIYENEYIARTARNSPEFTKILSEILAKEYPDLFGKIQDAKWYTKEGMDFRKISTMLDIQKYSPHMTKDFIEMMNLAETGESDKAYKIYENCFSETQTGTNIQFHFQDSQLFSTIIEHTQKVLDNGLQKGNMYELIQNNNKAKEESKKYFGNIPEKQLSELLGLLPTIEAQCPNGNIDALVQIIDSRSNIDPVYKQRFFAGLAVISSLSDKKDKQSTVEFYIRGVYGYNQKLNVSKERNMIEKTSKENNDKKIFSIIQEAFPDAKASILSDKNDQLNRILKDFINKDGIITIDGTKLKKELQEIFTGSTLADKLNSAHGGKEALEIIANIARESKEGMQAQIMKIDPSFTHEKISEFQQKKPKEYKKLQTILSGKESIEEKMQALKNCGMITKIPISREEQENYLTLVQTYFQSEQAQQYAVSILTDTGKGGKLEIFESYYRGEMSSKELNSKVEKREQEIQKQEQKGGESTTKTISATTLDFQTFNTNFTQIPDNQIISTRFAGKEVIIKKDSEHEISIYSGDIPIRGIRFADPKDIDISITNAMSSIQFLQKYGLGVFRDDIPTLVELINNRPKQNGNRENINLADGIDSTEELGLLESIAKLAGITVPEGTAPTEKLSILKNEFHTIAQQSGGLTTLLRAKGYVQTNSNSINIFHLQADIKNLG